VPTWWNQADGQDGPRGEFALIMSTMNSAGPGRWSCSDFSSGVNDLPISIV
jgi:hypothetical protein